MPTAGSTGDPSRASSAETLALYRDYARTQDPRLRDRLILTLAPMVKYIVYRKISQISSHFDADDFISVGIEALIRAIDRYDADRGVALESFVWTRVQGAVMDELRRQDWTPRSVRQTENRYRRALPRCRSLPSSLHGSLTRRFSSRRAAPRSSCRCRNSSLA